ncbi:ribosome-binding protein aMBF1 (putative translation factor) [Catenulispora sp. EB89]|uniref:helix-turn-helix domain-containing protein n=1 Tax=Catenulispora sp. EB89 TaxID=3156257 RepID=UPI0035194AD8
MDEDLKRLGEAVAAARKAKGWSLRQFALHAELAESTVARVDSGRAGASPTAYEHMEQALGWQPGTIAAILNGSVSVVDGSSTPPGTDLGA